jgi:tetratricopeptide (TPR) repeat protein/predicted Ser/Thr protein kinase
MTSGVPSDRDAPTRDRLGAPPVIPELEVQLAMRSMIGAMLGRAPKLDLGRYRVRQRLGQGGCGLVLLAEDPELDREVAIKIVLPAREGTPGSTWQRALQREAQALAKLKHPNVVEVYDTGTTADADDSTRAGIDSTRAGIYVVMERLRGRTLRQWLGAERRSWREILDVHVHAARGLRAAHVAGIVHRDFKPDNLLLTDDGRVVLIDFGLADEAGRADGAGVVATSDASSVSGSAQTDGTTRRSRMVGTPMYMAPEQHAGHAVGPAADQYAWCVSLFAALYGAAPFEATSMDQLAAAKTAGRVPPPTPGPPRALHRILRRGLSPDPTLRFGDMDALLDAVERATRSRRRLTWATGGAVAAVALVASFAGLRARHPCDASPLELDEVWSPARRTELAGSLAGLADPQAAAMGAGVGARLDAFAERWHAAYDEVCATEAPSATVTTRLDCLDRTRAQLDQVADAFGSLGLDELGNAPALLDSLRAPSDCVDADARAPEDQAELAAMWRRIDALGVGVDARGVLDDPAWAEQALARADELGDAGLASTIAFRLSQVARAAGRLDEAERHVRTAVFRAAAGHDYARALKLMPMLVLSVGSDLGDRAAAEQLIEHARTMAEHLDDPRHELAAIDNALAYILIEKGDTDGAIALYRRSAETFEAVGRPSSEYARCLLAISGWSVEQGDLEAAARHLEHARAILDEGSLPTDTNYASIAFQEGGIAEERDDLEGAASGFREAVSRLRPRLHGHPFLGVGLFAQAIAEARLGEFAAARASVAEAHALALVAHGEAHPDTVRYGLMRAQVEWLAGDAAAAAAAIEAPMQALPELPDRTEDGLRGAHHLAAWIHVAADDHDGARRHFAVLQSLPEGPAMYGIDLPRSMRRLEAALALATDDISAAGAILARPTSGPTEPREYDPALEAELDAVLWTRLAAAGGSLPQGIGPTAPAVPSRRMAVTRTAMLRTLAPAHGDGATLAARR